MFKYHSIKKNKLTLATIWFATLDGEVLQVDGEAYRHPMDDYDEQVAEELALGRALERLGKRLQKRAHNRVAMLDHNKRHSLKAKAEKSKKSKLNQQADNREAFQLIDK